MTDPVDTPEATRVIDTGVGRFFAVATPKGLHRLCLPGTWEERPPRGERRAGDPAAEEVLDRLEHELNAYVTGRLRAFTTPLDPAPTTPFLADIHRVCASIPYGSTLTYGQLARLAGHPGSARAAGRAMATNPIPILVPCHRVVARDGALTGYGGGLELKRWLLDLEAGHAQGQLLLDDPSSTAR